MNLIGNPESRPDSYTYLTLQPHPEQPISVDTFDELDALIREVKDSLGIAAGGSFSAISSGAVDEPDVRVSRYEKSDGRRELYVHCSGASSDGKECVATMRALNDAGTRRNPYQPAAFAYAIEDDVLMTHENPSLSDSDLRDLIDLVAQRYEAGSFVANNRKPPILITRYSMPGITLGQGLACLEP